MARVNRIKITPKRKTDRRKPVLLKAVRTNKKSHKIKKSQEYVQKVNKKQLRQGTIMSPVTPRASRRLAMQKQSAKRTIISPSSSAGRTTNAKTATPTDTIVIEDTDEEIEANILNLQLNPTPFFYEDRSPGLRDLEVPIYEIECKISKPGDETCDASVIELDSTMDYTQDSVLAKLNDTLPQSSSTENLSKKENLLPNINNCRNPSENHLQVIDLSDDSDDASVTPSYVPKQSIPLGYSIARVKLKPKISPKKQQPNISKETDQNPTLIPPLPTPFASPTSNKSNATETRTKRMIVIDGNNVAYGHLNGKMFSVKGLNLCIEYFKKLGHEVVAVVPQYKLKKTQSTDQDLLQKLHRQGDVILAPSKNLPGQYSSPYDDRLIFAVAEKFDGVIVSNDNFRDLLDSTPAWQRIIKTRVIGYTWVKDFFYVPDDPYGRQGPSLHTILHR